MNELADPIDNLPIEEQTVVNYWRVGYSMIEAYKQVMLSESERRTMKAEAVRKRSSRFYQARRIRDAMTFTPGARGEEARKFFENADRKQRVKAVKTMAAEAETNDFIQDTQKPTAQNPTERTVADEALGNKYISNAIASVSTESLEEKEKQLKEMRRQWQLSLQISDSPQTLSVTGSALFIMNVAMDEIIKRRKAIDLKMQTQPDSILQYTSLPTNLVAAFKASADVIIPFAPPPTPAERREMSKASQILCKLVSEIKEKPEDYAATSQTIDVTADAN